ncbi:MAG: VCBS repeat-containing protein [Bacteroidota bacterium]|nr:VCBS repeat-containing protein [Bacteroidota bacterium]
MKYFHLAIILLFFLSCGKNDSSFEIKSLSKYTLTISSNDGGEVSSPGGSYNEGSSVTITAIPNSKYIFENWSNGSTENPLTITINQNLSLTANFVKKKYPLTINIQGEGTVKEEIVSSAKSTDPTKYNSGTTVRLTADPIGDWVFEEWTGSVSETTKEITITLDEPKTVNVRFMRYFNYNQPSYFYQNNPFWIDIYEVINDNNPIFNTYGDFMNYDVSQGVADFNQDGYLDIIVAPNGSDNVVRRYPVEIYLNQGDNKTFVKETNFILNNLGTTTARKTIIGDFNGDQIPDAFFADHSIHNGFPGGIPSLILSNNEEFNFLILDQLPNGFYHTASSGDIDNDGDLDIYISALDNDGPIIDMESIFLINDGIGNFTLNEEIFNPDLTPITVELFDIDNDGNLDIIHGNAGDGTPTKIYWGNGENYSEERSIVIAKADETFQEVYDIDFYDLNSDSYKDIILLRFDWRTNQSSVQIIINKENQVFIDQTSELIDNIQNVHNIIWLSVSDIDSDGYIDLYETDKGHYNVPDWYSWEGVSGNTPAHWEWNGQRFIKITKP